MEIPQATNEIPINQSGNLTGQIILIIVLTLVNAFFSATEMAMVSINQNKLKHDAEEGDNVAKGVLKLLKNQSYLLSVIQIAITLAGFFNSATAATGISVRLANWMLTKGIPYSVTVAQVAITLLLSYLTIVFGELVPKRLAIINSEKVTRFAYKPVLIISILFKPFVALLSESTNLVLRLFGIKHNEIEAKITINDIRSLVQLGHSQGVIDTVESEMINSVISFDDTYAEEIMTPRTEVFMIDINDDFNEYKDEMLKLQYSRIPVYDEDVDNIMGILYIKDYLLEAYNKGFENVDIRSIIKPAYFIPERKNINELLTELQTQNRHMAVLIDEYGGFTGIVTMEDLLEEIVGEIDDEYDIDDPELQKIDDNTYFVKASISIKDFNYETGTKIDEEADEYDTMGGFIIYQLGYIPEDGEKPLIKLEQLEIQVTEVKDKRILYAIVKVINEAKLKKEEESKNV